MLIRKLHSFPQPCRSPDDQQGEGGTGEAPQGETAPAPAFVTKEDFASEFKTLKDEMFSTMRGLLKNKPSAAPSPAPAKKSAPAEKPETSTTSEQLAAMQASIEALTLEKSFNDAAAGFALAGEKREMVRSLFVSQRPEDAGAWVKKMADTFGFESAGAPSTQASQTQRTPAPPSSGAPAPTSSGTASTRVTEWTPSQYEQDFLLNAKDPTDPLSIDNKPYYQSLAKRAALEWKDKTLSLRDRK